MTCSGEADGLFELVVVSDGMYGLHLPPTGPGGGDTDALGSHSATEGRSGYVRQIIIGN